MIWWTENAACMEWWEMCTELWLENLKGKRLRGTHRFRWEHNIKMEITEIGLEFWLDSSGSGCGLVVGSCEQVNEPWDSVVGEKVNNWLVVIGCSRTRTDRTNSPCWRTVHPVFSLHLHISWDTCSKNNNPYVLIPTKTLQSTVR
jgi:hypothetical protein